MNFVIAADSDIGIKKDTNQDSLDVKVLNTPKGQMCLAVLCDGMGGLQKGEIASSTVVQAFDTWTKTRIPVLFAQHDYIPDHVIREEWEALIQEMNSKIAGFGNFHGIKLGTTLTAILITQHRYYVAQVGDSRLYELTSIVKQITEDQTLIQQEINMGRLTEEQAKVDPRRSVLLQCIGVNDTVHPAFYFGDPYSGQTFLICSDGFRHEISPQEIFQSLGSHNIADEQTIRNNIRGLIEMNKYRMEDDNISAIVIRVK